MVAIRTHHRRAECAHRRPLRKRQVSQRQRVAWRRSVEQDKSGQPSLRFSTRRPSSRTPRSVVRHSKRRASSRRSEDRPFAGVECSRSAVHWHACIVTGAEQHVRADSLGVERFSCRQQAPQHVFDSQLARLVSQAALAGTTPIREVAATRRQAIERVGRNRNTNAPEYWP